MTTVREGSGIGVLVTSSSSVKVDMVGVGVGLIHSWFSTAPIGNKIVVKNKIHFVLSFNMYLNF